MQSSDLDLQALREVAQARLGDLLDHEGTVLYSGVQTLVPGNLYILGVNPGGGPGVFEGYTIRPSLQELPEWRGNRYLQAWGRWAPTQHPLQRHLRWLIEKGIGCDLTGVCASNLIFVTSRNERAAGYPEFARICWPIHERILQIVQPRLLIVYGKVSLQWLSQDLDGENDVERLGSIPSGHRSWKCTAIRRPLAGQSRVVVGLPHLSRYDAKGKSWVVDWIKGFLVGSL